MNIEQIVEIRNWLVFSLGTIGAYITIKTYSINTQQRKLDNTFKILEYLRKHITREQIDTFIYLFHANNPTGVPENEFHLKNGRKDYVERMFYEGGCGKGDIHNMIEVFNLIAKQLNKQKLDEDLIWYEYGQIMLTCYRWTKYLEDHRESKIECLLKERCNSNDEYKEDKKRWVEQFNDMYKFFFDFNFFMKRATKQLTNKSIKYYTYLE